MNAQAIDRTEANRALAKVIAYRNCGKEAEAKAWFNKLASELGYTQEGD
jgi:hypothetical protein